MDTTEEMMDTVFIYFTKNINIYNYFEIMIIN